MGHEAIGVVEDVGAEVQNIKPGDLVDAVRVLGRHLRLLPRGPAYRLHGGFFDGYGSSAAQAEAVRVPYADGTLYPIPAGEDEALLPSLLTLSDVMGTGHHAAVTAKVARGHRVAVVGDGRSVCAASSPRSASRRADRHHGPARRLDRPRASSAPPTSSAERGEEAVERVKERPGGGAHSVLECVGTEDAMRTAVEIARPGGAVGRVGVPHYEAIPAAEPAFFGNITVGGGPPRARLPRRAPAGRPRGPDRAWPRLRPRRRPRRGARRLPGDERARGAQGDGEPVMRRVFAVAFAVAVATTLG